RRIVQTTEKEVNPVFAFDDKKVVFTSNMNLFAWDIVTGETLQLTNLESKDPEKKPIVTTEEQWLKNDQLQYLKVLKERKDKREATDAYNKNLSPRELRSINIGDRILLDPAISPDGKFVSYRLTKTSPDAKSTIVPNYVTESGFTNDIRGRTKVGEPQNNSEFFIYDRIRDTVLAIKTDSLPGIRDLPDYVKDYPQKFAEQIKEPPVRPVIIENTCWFQSEVTGYSHLYTVNVETREKKALTSGKYEVQQAELSKDKKYFYITTNEVHPGEQQFYRLAVTGGKAERITTMTGANQVTISPDDKYIAILYSYSNKPWELYLQENKPGGKAEQITTKAMSDEFKSYPWRDPEIITFTARDGVQVPARLYKPTTPAPGKPAVLFVHGAGYLQNAHKWWSYYFREFMFNNLLADNGYY